MNNNTKRKKIKVCSIEGCSYEINAKGYCNRHYLKLRRYRDPLYVKEKKKCKLCDRTGTHRGYCKKHYDRLIQSGEIKRNRKKPIEKCAIDNCHKDKRVKGYCTMHYQRLRLNGDPLIALTNRDPSSYCKVKGCDNVYHAKSMCKKHYYKHYKKLYGSTEKGKEINRINLQKRRSMKRNAPINDFSINDWKECLNYFNEECAYCGKRNVKLTQEHVYPVHWGGSNTKTNIIPSCGRCNFSKGDRLLEEWYSKQPFYDKEKEEEIYKWMGYKKKDNRIQLQLF